MELTRENIWGIYAPIFAKITPKMTLDLLNYSTDYASGSVLDAGTGVGKILPFISQNSRVSSLTAIDSNPFMLKEAKLFYEKIQQNKNQIKLKVKFSQIDLEKTTNNDSLINLKYKKNQFNSVLSLNVIYSLEEPIKFLKNAHHLLKPGGKLILSSLNRNADLQKLEHIIDKEFENNLDYNLFKECNYFLTSQKFKAKSYSLQEIESILDLIGFSIIKSSNNHYHGANFTVIAKKI